MARSRHRAAACRSALGLLLMLVLHPALRATPAHAAQQGAAAPFTIAVESPPAPGTSPTPSPPGPIVPSGNPLGKLGGVAIVVVAVTGLWIYRVIRKGL